MLMSSFSTDNSPEAGDQSADEDAEAVSTDNGSVLNPILILFTNNCIFRGSTATAVTGDPDAVTSTVYQDPALTKLYENLPFLKYVSFKAAFSPPISLTCLYFRKFTPITPFSRTASATSARFKFSEIAPTLTASETEYVESPLLASHLHFANS